MEARLSINYWSRTNGTSKLQGQMSSPESVHIQGVYPRELSKIE